MGYILFSMSGIAVWIKKLIKRRPVLVGFIVVVFLYAGFRVFHAYSTKDDREEILKLFYIKYVVGNDFDEKIHFEMKGYDAGYWEGREKPEITINCFETRAYLYDGSDSGGCRLMNGTEYELEKTDGKWRFTGRAWHYYD